MPIDPAFMPWASSKGVKCSNVEPRIMPGRGIGIVAVCDIRANQTILSVPTRAVRTIDTVPKHIKDALHGVSVHGILAAEIALDDSDDFAIWRTVLPTREDLEGGMPMMWPSELQALLPKRAKDLLDNQNTTFRRECDIVLKAFPTLTRDEYMLSWVLINTRTFYNSMPKMKIYAHSDRLVCMPVADLFNHDQGCKLVYSALGYSVQTDRVYKQGEEVYVSYGPHSNDFLLTEYGFILDTNRWDEVYLDEVILPLLNKTQRAELESVGFLGRYTLDDQTPGCHRTQVALRMLCCTPGQWQRFFDACEDGRSSQAEVDGILLSALKDFQQMFFNIYTEASFRPAGGRGRGQSRNTGSICNHDQCPQLEELKRLRQIAEELLTHYNELASRCGAAQFQRPAELGPILEPAEPLLQYAYPATASTTARSATSFTTRSATSSTTACSVTGPGTTAPPPSPSPSSSSLSSSWSFYP
ncbi:hypothetical protein FGSG_08862 [Fusarium graminearum PH-1]|uniref:hypothetical protein n=1 Tax=Gibberella zeae (strain ATCC MYA-4620 / CBS 123657 / FGSC 9075 / NRRL 31084 / PH-1) TaxID=229533 RepID=UPI00021F1C40|nr:hypothetical protein FGSG_08862 [Fusarium graminearum PH-1]ESU14425.1 hypothetical protein FGSG_08862 [Fusarium graminearum PH-1]|eukprot:XP_011319850.1 hypothetical protein FGSG_08862 [Fusarium graminearum PH-1]